VPGLLAVDGDALVVDGTVAGLVAEAAPAGGDAAAGPAGPGWLRIAAEELAAAGDPVGALDLVLAAGDREAFAGLLVAADSRLREVPPIEALDRWLARLGPADAVLSARLAVLRPAVRARSAAARVAVLGPSTPAGTPRAPRRRLVRGLGALAAVGLFALGYALPEPTGLERAGLVTLAAIVATVPLLVFDILPDYAVMLLFAVALVVPGHVPPPDILAGFATPAWLMILTLLAVGTAVSRSGLMFRLVLLSLERLPPRYGVQSLVLAGTGVLLTAGITSGATRIALGVSIARGMADAMGFAPQSRGAAAIGLLTFFTFSQMGTLFLTGTFTCLVLHDLLPTAARREVTWWYWLGVAAVPIAIVFVLVYVVTLVTFRPQREVRVHLDAVRVQRELLGPVAYEEIWSAVALAVLIVGFATREYHGIGPAWLAVLVFLLLFTLGVLDRTALQTGGTLGLLVYSGVILSLGGVFATLAIDTWLASVVRSGLPPIVANPYGFVLSVALIAFALHFFVPWITASTILALVTMPVAEALGFHPLVAVLVTLIAGDHTLFPFVNPAYPILYFASEGALFTHAQARPLLWLETGFRLAALLLSVPVWRLFGLM
jgi:hypothetical protein